MRLVEPEESVVAVADDGREVVAPGFALRNLIAAMAHIRQFTHSALPHTSDLPVRLTEPLSAAARRGSPRPAAIRSSRPRFTALGHGSPLSATVHRSRPRILTSSGRTFSHKSSRFELA